MYTSYRHVSDQLINSVLSLYVTCEIVLLKKNRWPAINDEV
jgi:hypothetical protein